MAIRDRGWSPDNIARTKLLEFEGYGADIAKVIFVGRDEYCDADPSLQRDNIFLRCKDSAYALRRADKDDALAALADVVKDHVRQ